jgi:hypothetical protein
MEHAMRIVEGLLAIFGAGKFCHEIYELTHHIVHLIRK